MPIISKAVCKAILDEGEAAKMVTNCVQWELITDANDLTEKDGEEIQKFFQQITADGKKLMEKLKK